MVRWIALGVIVLVACGWGCASQRTQAYERALAESTPPPDFWLAIAVLRAPADAASRAAAYQKLPVEVRPSRYIMEADGILRAATGSGASLETFPDQTRQLTPEEVRSLWETLRTSALVRDDHPARRGVGPTVSSIGDRTVYVVSFAAGGWRRVLAMDALPEPGEGAEDARRLVERAAELAWVK